MFLCMAYYHVYKKKNVFRNKCNLFGILKTEICVEISAHNCSSCRIHSSFWPLSESSTITWEILITSGVTTCLDAHSVSELWGVGLKSKSHINLYENSLVFIKSSAKYKFIKLSKRKKKTLLWYQNNT